MLTPHKMDKESTIVEELDRLKIKEERAIRNKIKKAAKKLERKQQQEQKEMQLKVQSIGGNINLITREFVDNITKKNLPITLDSVPNDEINFPELGRSNRIIKKDTKNVQNFNSIDCSSDKQVLSLGDFIDTKPSRLIISKKLKPNLDTNYIGNGLDADLPVRKRGKFRETPKPKKCSALKREINLDKKECVEGPEQQRLYLTDVFPNVALRENTNDIVSAFISRIVELQEKLFKRDPIKGKYKRRYVVGFHEAKKYLNLNKAKVIIIATDIQFIKVNDAMSSTIEEIIGLCNKSNVFYSFALKRRKLGILTLKYVPISCVTILNHEGAEEQLNNMKLGLSNSGPSTEDDNDYN